MQTLQLTSEKQYRYAELDDTAKQRARDHYIQYWIPEDWYDWLFDEFKASGKDLGFDIDDINFSGFWSQGDGAMWTGRVELPTFIEKHLPESIGRDCWLWLIQDACVEETAGITRTSHHYSHSNCMGLDSIPTYEPHEGEVIRLDCILKGAPIDSLWALIMNDKACPIHSIDDLEEFVLDEARAFADSMYDELRTAYESECSEDSVADCYNSNDVFFNEEGVIL